MNVFSLTSINPNYYRSEHSAFRMVAGACTMFLPWDQSLMVAYCRVGSLFQEKYIYVGALFEDSGITKRCVKFLSVLYRRSTLHTLYRSPSVCQIHSENASIFRFFSSTDSVYLIVQLKIYTRILKGLTNKDVKRKQI